MMGAIKEETIGYLFNIEVEVAPSAPVIDPAKLTYIAPNEDGAAEAHGANEDLANEDRANENRQQRAQANSNQQKPASGQGSSFFRQ
jgi:preprotein translocase subunit SecA